MKYHTDGAPEFSEGELETSLPSQSISTTIEIPNSSDMNGQAELSIRTQGAAAHSALFSSSLLFSYWDYALEDSTNKRNFIPIKTIKLSRDSLYHHVNRSFSSVTYPTFSLPTNLA